MKTQLFVIGLGDVVPITDARFRLVDGKLLRVIAVADNAAKSEVRLTLWG